ncbi:MAG: c-type cytochrome [Herbaspirillum sp.]
MFKLTSVAAGILLVVSSAATLAEPLANIGRSATPKEIAAWNIDVRPDFKGLPVGSGSVHKGEQVFEERCASCHGSFGESNKVFTPLAGGTTSDDIKTGHVAALATNTQPQVTSLMKLATVSTLWDYIHRAMPWNAPKSLSTEEVYSVVAYILNLGDIVPADFVLSDKNIAEVQKRMPNRNGMTRDHGLWETNGKPDVKNVACMKNCPTDIKMISVFPESAMDSHGNLADQNRNFGEVRGLKTSSASSDKVAATGSVKGGGLALAKQFACVACHGVTNKIVGPGFTDVAKKYSGNPDAEAKLLAKIRNGGSGVWGDVPMPAQKQVPEKDLATIVKWILSGAK